MSTPKKTKFRAIMQLEAAITDMIRMGFIDVEIKEIVRDIIKSDSNRRVKNADKLLDALKK